jgi:hypothetical protein
MVHNEWRRYPMNSIEVRDFGSSLEVRTFDKGKVEIIDFGGRAVGRATLEPGWKWSTSVKPLGTTESCQAPHFQYHLSGVLHVLMDDGTERDIRAGEVSLLAAGHDAWVVGNDPVVLIDFEGMGKYAVKATVKEEPKCFCAM